MAAQGHTNTPFNAFQGWFKNKLNERRDARIPYRAPFYLLWDEHYAKACCHEISNRGLSLESPRFIPVGTQVSLRSDTGALFGSASVKHVTKHGMKYVLGVELGYGLLDDALALVREVYSTPRAK